MPETTILISSSEEEENGRDGPVRCMDEEDGMIEDPIGFDNDNAFLEDETLRKKKTKRRKKKTKHSIEFNVAQGQLNVDNSNHREDNCTDRVVKMVGPAMLKEQINPTNVERPEALAAGNGENSVVAINVCSSGSLSDEGNSRFCCGVGQIVPAVATAETKKKKRRKKLQIIKEEATQAERLEDQGTENFMETESTEIENNIVLRQLLRGPRYFDPPGSSWSLCLRCGDESHTQENCTLQKKKKPCYRCASFEHNGKRCKKLSKHFLSCKEIANHSLEELQDQRLSSISCLRCGDSEHDMFSCGNDYSTQDLKEIRCYICKGYGHLCCVDFPNSGIRQVSCYNCGQSGHLGSECTDISCGELWTSRWSFGIEM